ncbi:MAG TPA: glycerol kinase GlpK [Deinococcales bacterium]|nr:glycerol kinase GlpK [Deinococcales bacterium]
MRHVLALDQGTTSSRAILFDELGRPSGVAQREFPQHFPSPGWVEHDPNDILNSQLFVMRQMLAAAPGPVSAIGITNQRETTLLWDRRTGKAVHPAIVWQDRRTAGRLREMRTPALEANVRDKTGLVLDPYFSASKLQWLLENVPGAMDDARAGRLAFGTVDSWLIWHLTGGRVHATDVTNASRTLLFNIHTGDWDPELLDLFGVPRQVLPEVRPSSGAFGVTADGIPIAGVAGDQHAALFGQACQQPGQAKNTYGTGCFMLMNTGEPVESRHGLLTTPAWALSGPDGPRICYALEGSIFTAGAVVQWLRDQLGFIARASDVETLAGSVPDSGGVMLVPAFAGLGAPDWDPEARGTILGLTRGSSKAHIARAALEAIAFQVADVVKAMESDSGIRLASLRVDGGAAANNLLMQVQADLLGVPVERPVVLETTAFGAASLAALGAGLLASTDELGSHWQLDRRFEPGITADERESRMASWARAKDRARRWSLADGTAG